VARLIPFYEFDIDDFFCSDGAPADPFGATSCKSWETSFILSSKGLVLVRDSSTSLGMTRLVKV